MYTDGRLPRIDGILPALPRKERDYNNCCEAFPSNLIAVMFGFKTRSFFNVDPAVRKTPGAKPET